MLSVSAGSGFKGEIELDKVMMIVLGLAGLALIIFLLVNLSGNASDMVSKLFN